MFAWEHLHPSHLRLSGRAAVPVLVTTAGQPLAGMEMFSYLVGCGPGGGALLPAGEAGQRVRQLCSRIEVSLTPTDRQISFTGWDSCSVFVISVHCYCSVFSMII